MTKMIRTLRLVVLCLLPLLLTQCGVYSLSGISIDYETTKTVSIQNFFNDADLGPPDLAQTFTNELRDYFQQNTDLSLVTEAGDLQMEGSISSYRLAPIAPEAAQGDQQVDAAALTRLTITVQVTYLNTKDDTFNFENKNFSFFSDFDNDQNLATIEAGLIDEIYEQIILDIFAATVANW